MFRHLATYSLVRSPVQAIGFYLSYLVFFVILGGIAGGLQALLSRGLTARESFDNGLVVGTVVAVIACLLLTLAVVRSKRLFHFWHLVLVPVAGMLAIVGGAIIGLLPAALLTTLKNGTKAR